MINPVIEQPKSSTDGFELPCGYLDASGELVTAVMVREMTGHEEEILAARNMPPMRKMNSILSRCTTSVGGIQDKRQIEQIVMDLTQGDRMYLLFAIRRVSLGDDFPFTTTCPKCEAVANLTLDLSTLDVKKMPDPRIRTYDVELAKSKKKIVMKVLTGRGEDMISKAAASGVDVISVAMLARIESLDGRPAKVTDLKDLSLQDRNQLRDAWQDREGGIDTSITLTCSACDHEYETDIDVGSEGFFNPLAVSKGWNSKSNS